MIEPSKQSTRAYHNNIPSSHLSLPPSVPSCPPHLPVPTEAVVVVTKAVADAAGEATSAKQGPTRLFNASIYWTARARMALPGVGLSMAWSFTLTEWIWRRTRGQ